MKIDGRPNSQDVHSTRGGPGIHAFPHDDGEVTYDCVIVGSGASGLAAAKVYRGPLRQMLLFPAKGWGQDDVAVANTHSAIDEGYRAVQDLPD